MPRLSRPATAVAPALTALALTCALPAVAAAQLIRPAPGAPTTLTPQQQAARAIYKEMVEINTVDSVGSVTRAAEAVAARFRSAGFPEGDIHLLGPADAPAKKNLIVRYRGKGKGKPILLLAHLDVVAALRSDWPRDPFAMVEQDGYFLGRGVADDKSMAAIFTANLLRYKAEGWVPERDLILALTADEEGGNRNGVAWLLANHRALLDAEYAINEGGGGTLMDDQPAFHSIQAAEKVPVNYTLTVLNTGGHSSVPRKDNAIYQLAQAIGKLERFTFPVALNEITTPFFRETAKVEMPSLAAAMRALVANPADSAAAATISTDPRYASMLRTTCVATRLAAGHADNALPQTATANVNCRIVPTSTAAEVQATLERIFGDPGVKVTVRDRGERYGAKPSAVQPELLAATTALTKQLFNGVPVIPTMSTGATDGRFLRAEGIPTYGVSGIFSAPGETNAHGRDEKLRIKSFYDGLDFLYQLVKRVAGPGTPIG
ncbi:MAG: M20/M25/M40 family metallo-hydrolase [Gemmatimonadetes bacterium]|nr:M20/M25/M40 family metallo-hydrolase [Gemmatimonadota bacterium]